MNGLNIKQIIENSKSILILFRVGNGDITKIPPNSDLGRKGLYRKAYFLLHKVWAGRVFLPW
jgi:hypothetical protein